MLTVCGIDPGLDGGITFLSYDSTNRDARAIKVESFPMPTLDIGKKRVLNARGIAELLVERAVLRAVIERVGAMPGQGVTSMFSFGYGAGLLEGVLATLAIPYELVLPQRWMKAVLTGLPKGTDSKASILWCQRTFPQVDWKKSDRSRAPHDGMTDSCCLAWYALTNRYGLS